MAGTIKGITIQIGADTTKLSTALNTANKSIRQTQTELRAVEKGLKLNPTNINLWRDKQQLLTNKIADTKTKLDALKQAQAKMDASGVNKNSAEYKKLQREIDLTEQELKGLEEEQKNFGSAGAQAIAAIGEKLKDLGKKVEAAGQTLTQKLTLPLVALGTVAAKKFADVDKTMQLTNATMGNGTKEANLLEKAMKKAASNSTFGMNDAATATLNFARSGLTAKEAANTLAPAMNLAAAGGGNLDVVSQGLVATINGFGDTFDKAGDYADVFANACNNSALDVDGLSTSMSVAAPIFKAAGYNVKDAALYMGLMANKGIEANTAANALKTGFARLVSPSKQAQTWMDKLGISVTNADGSMKDSVTIQKDLHKAFGNLSESEKTAAASAIFGKNQMSNWLSLIETAPEEVDSLSESLDDQGTAAKQAKAMMSGFGGSIEKLKSSVDVAATSLGEALAPTILKVAKAIQKAVEWFNGLSKSQQQMVAKIALIIAAIGPLLIIIGKVMGVIGTVMTFAPTILWAVTSIATLMTGTLIPAIGGLIAAIAPVVAAFLPFIVIGAAVVAAGVLIYKNWDTIKSKAKELAKLIATKFEEIKTAIKTKLETAKTILTTIWNNIKTTVQNAINTVKTVVSNGLETVKTFFTTKLSNAASTVSSKLSNIKNYFTSKMNEAKTTVSNTLDSIKNFFSSKLGDAVSSVSSKLGDIASSFKKKIDDAKSTVDTKLSEIKSKFTSVVGEIPGVVTTKLKNLASNFTSVLSGIPGKVKSKLEDIKKEFSKIVLKLQLKVPEIKVHGGKAPWGIAGQGVKPSFDVDWKDKGGIFYGPTIIGVGEKRPEFVGALDDLRSIVREESGGGMSAQMMSQMIGLLQELVSQGGRQVIVNQTINAGETSYAGQQREAAYQFKQIARAL